MYTTHDCCNNKDDDVYEVERGEQDLLRQKTKQKDVLVELFILARMCCGGRLFCWLARS